MPIQILNCYTRTLTAAAFVLMASSGYSQKTNPFSKFGGRWVGNGEIYLSNGTKELIKCNGDFVSADALNVVNLKLGIKCANPGYKFELQSDLILVGNEVSGTWTEISRGVNGRVTAKLKDDQINGVAESPSFTAILEIKNLGDKQHVSISSPGSEISNVLIGLIRRSGAAAQQTPPSQ